MKKRSRTRQTNTGNIHRRGKSDINENSRSQPFPKLPPKEPQRQNKPRNEVRRDDKPKNDDKKSSKK